MNPSYDNSFGSFGSGGMNAGGISASSMSEDIVLSGNQKKSKKGLIVGIIAVIVVVVIFVMGILATQKQQKVSANDDIKEAFNQYMNLLLNNDDSTAEIKGEYNEEENTSAGIMRVLVGDANAMLTYAKNLNVSWGNFAEETNNFEIEDGIKKDDYSKRVDFIVTYMNNRRKLNEDKIMDLAATEETADVQNMINNYFAEFERFDFDEAKSFVENGRLYYTNTLNLVKALREIGCVDDDEVEVGTETVCDESSVIEGNEDYEELDTYYANTEDAVYLVVQYLIENAWKINSELYGGNR